MNRRDPAGPRTVPLRRSLRATRASRRSHSDARSSPLRFSFSRCRRKRRGGACRDGRLGPGRPGRIRRSGAPSARRRRVGGLLLAVPVVCRSARAGERRRSRSTRAHARPVTPSAAASHPPPAAGHAPSRFLARCSATGGGHTLRGLVGASRVFPRLLAPTALVGFTCRALRSFAPATRVADISAGPGPPAVRASRRPD